MEKFTLNFPSAPTPEPSRIALCGVVSSGNLEVLVESGADRQTCTVEVNTSAHGFREIWQAVLSDFASEHPAGGLSIAINDAGATPAVVTLRLDQAFESSRSPAR